MSISTFTERFCRACPDRPAGPRLVRPDLVPLAASAAAAQLHLLQNALDQTQGAGRYRAADWRALLSARLADLDTRALARDVQPFLERPEDAALIDRANLEAVLAC